ncbi:glycoside hydrolase family 30 beta sandwich domain-containing protein [Bacteroides sp. 51]|uniref:glycoside hydrolase family 30 protein n=1 Tax=Bacteroides sp. 51 TaxID=2302938 RepID=UPI0013D43308|nr:glycoside hydrolase family 30 protein [Bacteroides sp. 51]NDV80579.1 glycosyl hydrolase family 30 [Bacteroides sp. 51]
MKTRISIFFLLIAGYVSGQNLEWIYSVETSPWQKEKAIKPLKSVSDISIDIDVSDQKAQYIDGFGGCFNEMGWDALMTLTPQERDNVIQNLFSSSQSNYTYCRMPIGASDYGLGFYSLNDVADDFNMINFNIHRDRYILIPYIKAALQKNPDMKIFASPWCPPAWMKSNNHYAGNTNGNGTDYNGMPEEKITETPTTAFKMERGYLKSYALYFTKFIQAYEKEGINVEAIHVQNEPCSNQIFPSCNWRSEDLAYFISDFLGPKFEEEKIKSDIYFGTINRDNPNYTKTALDNDKAAKYIKGVGFQWAGKGAIPTIHKEYPQLKIMQTESECGNGANDWAAAEYTWGLINHYLNNGANVYAYWNMVLDDTGKSMWGWKQNALISINKETGKVTYNPEFYIMKHVSHFVSSGAYRLLTLAEKNDHLAFINPDGKIIVVVVNKENTEKTIHIQINGKVYPVSMKAKSFNTFSI